jgi:hypothetical protein
VGVEVELGLLPNLEHLAVQVVEVQEETQAVRRLVVVGLAGKEIMVAMVQLETLLPRLVVAVVLLLLEVTHHQPLLAMVGLGNNG